MLASDRSCIVFRVRLNSFTEIALMNFRNALPSVLGPVALVSVTYLKATKSIETIRSLKSAETVDDFLTSKPGHYFVLSWSIAESLYWWVFPDYLMMIAGGYVRRFHPKTIAYAAAGTAIGGTGAYLVGRLLPSTSAAIVAHVPFVTEQMQRYTEQKLEEHGALGVAYHPSSSVPFKVFSYLAGQRHLNFAVFMGVGVALRTVRFAGAYVFAFLFAKLVGERLRKLPAHYVLVLYTVVYTAGLAYLQKGRLLVMKGTKN